MSKFIENHVYNGKVDCYNFFHSESELKLRTFCKLQNPAKVFRPIILKIVEGTKIYSTYKCEMFYENEYEEFPQDFIVEYYTDKGYFYWRIHFYSESILVELEDGSDFPMKEVSYIDAINYDSIEELFMKAYKKRERK